MASNNSARWPLTYKILAVLSLALLPLGIAALIVSVDARRDLARAAQTRAQLRVQTLASEMGRDIGQDLLMLELLGTTLSLQSASNKDCTASLVHEASEKFPRGHYAIVDAQGRIICGKAEIAALATRMPARAHTLSASHALLVERPVKGLLLLRETTRTYPQLRIVAVWDRAKLDAHIRRQQAKGETMRLLWQSAPDQDHIFASGHQQLRVQAQVPNTPLALEIIRPAVRLEWPQALSVSLPILMWLVGLIACWLAVHRLVVRPLQMVRRTVNRYAAGDFTARIGQPRALQSRELASLGKSFDSVAERIMAHEAEQSQAIATQKRLTREVHHRVKNNLQIIGSLLSIQAREAQEPGALHAYAAMQLRVAALAIVHRWLFEHGREEAVELRPLVHELCQSIESNLRERGHGSVHIQSQVPSMRIGQDIAVPIAFLITEMAAAAADQVQGGETEIQVEAVRHNQRALLTISSPVFQNADLFAATSASASARIAHGMARQLRGRLHYDPAQSCYSVEFLIRS